MAGRNVIASATAGHAMRLASAVGVPVALVAAIVRLGGGQPEAPASGSAHTPVAAAAVAPSAPSTSPSAAVDAWCKNRLLEALLSAQSIEDTALLREGPVPGDGYRVTVGAPAAGGVDLLANVVPQTKPDEDAEPVPEPFDAVMIVMVPDPIDSGLRRMFDEDVSAVRLGMARLGWVQDRQWLPWQDRLLTEPKDARAAEMCRRDVPGALTFRKRGEKGQPLHAAVLLVGETPTWGAQPAALKFALDRASGLKRPTGRQNWPIAIVGPAFTGGADSLVEALNRKKAAPFAFHIVAGEANGTGLLQTLTRSGMPVSSTNIAEEDLECEFWRFLDRKGVDKVGGTTEHDGFLRRTAVLRESGTAFGSHSTAKDDPSALESELHSECELHPELELDFPLHIAAVRDAYAHDESADAAGSVARRTYLDVNLTEKPGTDDLVETSQQSASSKDAALTRLLSGLSTEGVDYVGISATDIADALFIARKVRDVVPDVRIAFFTNDDYFTHPSFSPYLFGSFVVSAYPFLGSDEFSIGSDPPAQSGQDGGPKLALGHSHLPFQSEDGEATMNAVVAGMSLSYEGPGARKALFELRWPGEKAKGNRRRWEGPFAWIATVSRTGIVPVDVTRVTSSGYAFPACTVQEGSRTPCWCAGSLDGPCPSSDGPPSPTREREDDPSADIPSVRLHIDEDVTPPNLWTFGLAALAALAFADWRAQRVRRLAMKGGWPECDEPSERCGHKRAELDTLRLRYFLAATIRSTVLAATLTFGLTCGMAALLTHSSGLSAGAGVRWCIALLVVFGLVVSIDNACRNVAIFASCWRKLGCRAKGPAVSWPVRSTSAEFAALALANSALMSIGWRPGRTIAERAWAARIVAGQQALFAGLILFFIIFGIFMGHGCALLHLLKQEPEPQTLLTILRGLPLLSGSSPAWPLFCTFLVVWVWSETRMTLTWVRAVSAMRADDRGVSATALPFWTIRAEGDVKDGFNLVELHAVDAAAGPSSTRHLVAVPLVIALLLVVFVLKPVHTIDPPWAEAALQSALGLEGFLCVLSLLHLVSYWRALRYLLGRISCGSLGPMLRTVDKRLRIGSLFALPPERGLGFALACCTELLGRASSVPRPAAQRWPENLPRNFEAARARMRDLMAQRADKRTASEISEGMDVGPILVRAAAEICVSLRERARDGVANAKLEAPLRRYVASVVAMFVQRYTRVIPVLMYGIVAQAVLLLFTIEGYAFEPRRLLLTCVWVLMLGIAATTLWVLTDANRNAALSALSGTTAGEVDFSWDFVIQLVRWVAVPILAIAAAEYPGPTGSLLSWIGPAVRVVH